MGRKNCGQHYGGIGEMTKFIIVVFLVLSAFIVFTIPYRHRYKRKLSKKKHKLWGLYGVGMLIVDRLPKKIFQNTGVNNDLKKITVKEHIIKEQYFYYFCTNLSFTKDLYSWLRKIQLKIRNILFPCLVK